MPEIPSDFRVEIELQAELAFQAWKEDLLAAGGHIEPTADVEYTYKAGWAHGGAWGHLRSHRLHQEALNIILRGES